MLPLSQVDQLLAEGRLKEAARLLDDVPMLSRALQIVRLRLEMQIGNPLAAKAKASELLEAHLTTLERIACLDIVGRVSVVHGDISNGIRTLRMALELAVAYEDKVIEARQHASLTESLLHRVGVDAALLELPILRKLTIQAGDALASIEFHLIGAEIAMKRLQTRQLAAHLGTAAGMLARYPNLIQLARQKLLEAVDMLSSSKFAALALFEEAQALSRRSGSISTAIPPLANIAYTALALAKFADCRSYLDELAPLIRRGGGTEIVHFDTELRLAFASGATERTDAMAERVEELASRHEHSYSYEDLWHKLTRARWLYRRGRPLEGVSLALDAMPHAIQTADNNLLQRMRLVAVEGFVLTGRPREGASMLAAGVLATSDPLLELQAEASRVAGVVAVDDLSAAVTHFERSARVFGAIGSITARGQTIASAGDAFAQADGGGIGAGWQDLPQLYRLPRQTSIRLDAADLTIADPRQLGARVIESVGAAIDLAVHPTLFGHELMEIIHHAKAADVAALVEQRDNQPAEVHVWLGCDAARARTLREESSAVRIPLGTGHGRTCEIVAMPPDAPAARATLLAVERLAHAALELHGARERERERAVLWPEQTPEQQQLGMVFASEAMVELVKTARRVALTNVPVLITGETGTGKELLARAIHQASPRGERPFVPFNCTAVAREMIDSQLFGYRRGAFTGAHEAFPGVIRAATGGTLFLDEIGEVGLDVQPKLLRFLESGEVHPLGETRPSTADVRIVAATNANLDQLVGEGRFREDLFYRLDVIRLKIPPLRERREEIPLLVDHFLLKFSHEAKKLGLRVAEETMEYLVLYRWPGNARQLANEMHRMVAMAEPGALLMPEHLSRDIASSRRTVPTSQRELAPTELVVRLDQPLSAAAEHLERAMIQHAMRRMDGRVEDAARILGVSRKGLYLKRLRLRLE